MASTTSTPLDTVRRYYALVDAGDTEGSFELFADDAVVTFGDQPDLVGREAIANQVRSMVGLGSAVTHEITRSYESAGPGDRTTVVCEAVVTYTMARSGNVIPHNAVTISEVDKNGKIAAQRNVGDLRPVIEDHQAHA